MEFTVNDLTFYSPDHVYERDELLIVLNESLEKAKESNFSSDQSFSLSRILKENYGIYLLYREKFEKMPLHFELKLKRENYDDLPF